ncbi:bifunctional phosphopantothenoylcysteine decarboxylase/phosphopantothenate--cysteine ligase CoaBC [Lentilactobacillus otakiensis]|uniref:Coenzyme A biosynthesis bifunctional protein CoaBC n=1 Tax=Lentilactobacillus otakiensis DSM 19908 = JCM 15040 TaxID=1423780 RepID=S4NEV8_9LACO|nr:bifunctional phosphopantothenoylcysteine decarboxylase/phosphopantothenate--cysteine ligase CoaBC [Lentilactobacillus otakiensis]KRL09248.1 phosphopantothenoylcysteine decarboxylase phosphopantothenate cysteine ligase [Lentilactobacillus otakiensis DSM 19908 = JCM 15040]MBZ3776697.1 bifunctional phosphopantothenoylcysteine decarboxylase/phosphopantothenate--cysteine ligase CoaBC [Lentilactobacillus otakiensis]MDV3519083.1 bifunctional phosphopantothenoylcysteine decarboxylase/phosphopantothen
MFRNKNVAVFVTGSIAVYKSLTLVRELVKSQNTVHVIMSEAAQKFVTPLAFQTVSKNKVLTNDFTSSDPTIIPHVNMADTADLAIVAPASANTIAKMANGIADNMVTSTLLTMTSPVFVVPAMNTHMLTNFATQRNIDELKTAGIHVMEPAEGFLAEGYSGKGRMPEPDEILSWIDVSAAATGPLAGKKVVVTAGGTREPLDPVRYLTNHSSGKMGFAIATAARQAGAEVTLIAANPQITPPEGIQLVKVETAAELLAAVKAQFKNADILVMAAAVADYRPAEVAKKKIKKTADNQTMSLELVRNPDILKEISTIKQANQIVVGFAAETNDLIANAEKKIKSKNLDLIVANDVSQAGIGFNADDNQVTFLFADGRQIKTTIESKSKVASQLIDIISNKLQK